jgi:hypothetical protein
MFKKTVEVNPNVSSIKVKLIINEGTFESIELFITSNLGFICDYLTHKCIIQKLKIK